VPAYATHTPRERLRALPVIGPYEIGFEKIPRRRERIWGLIGVSDTGTWRLTLEGTSVPKKLGIKVNHDIEYPKRNLAACVAGAQVPG